MTLISNYLQNKLTEYNFLCLTPRSLKMLLVKFFVSEYNSWVKIQDVIDGPRCHNQNILSILSSLYVYIYIYIYVCIHICILYICMYVCICIYIYDIGCIWHRIEFSKLWYGNCYAIKFVFFLLLLSFSFFFSFFTVSMSCDMLTFLF